MGPRVLTIEPSISPVPCDPLSWLVTPGSPDSDCVTIDQVRRGHQTADLCIGYRLHRQGGGYGWAGLPVRGSASS
jgi:hypothetical protein